MDFSKCVPSSSEYELDGLFLHFLRRLELHLQLSFDSFDELHINSAFRSLDYEKRMGRDGSSAHSLGLAADISCTNNSLRYQIIQFAISNGVNRIGVYKNFIHLDMASYKHKKGEFIIWYG